MFSHSLFRADEFSKFEQAVKLYCESMGYHGLDLTEEELTQLSGYMGDNTVTPEARSVDIADKLHFEIKRGLARRYGFELMLRGDKSAYEEFTSSQHVHTTLSLLEFNSLSDEARSLSDDVKVSVRASCFLTINDKVKQVLKENSIVLSNDSEEFLSQLIPLLSDNRSLLPLTRQMTPAQLSLMQKMFWPTMHLRHMLYTEGGDNMSRSFSEGVISQAFSKQDFSAWKWRWLTNLFGFQLARGAKYYDAQTHQLTCLVIDELKKIFTNPHYSYLDNYLVKRADLAGINAALGISEIEQQLLGHLAAYYNQVNVLTPEKGGMIYAAYMAFKTEFNDAGMLASLYEAHRKDKAVVTPTYVPAIINTAFVIFKNKFKMTDNECIKNASQFMCQVLLQLYSLPHEKRISCMSFAKESYLQGVLEKWAENHMAFNFVLNQNAELIAEEKASFGLVIN